MVSRKEYLKHIEDYWKTVTVITTIKMRNGYIEIPEGTVCTITRKLGGFSLKTEPCKTCGVSVFISNVQPEDVAILNHSKEKGE